MFILIDLVGTRKVLYECNGCNGTLQRWFMYRFRWQDETVTNSAGVMTKGEARDCEADAAFYQIIEKLELRVDSAQTAAEAIAVEICGKVKAQRIWDSYYEQWELDKFSDSVRIRFPSGVLLPDISMDTDLKKINDIVGDDIPEVIFREGMFCWKLHNRREPNHLFLVCRYEAFEKLSRHLGYRPDHVKASLKRESYACFELDLRRVSKSRRNILVAN